MSTKLGLNVPNICIHRQATGMYTNSWDPNKGQILRSTDQGKTFTPSPLPFKIGGNMPGRGMGEVCV